MTYQTTELSITKDVVDGKRKNKKISTKAKEQVFYAHTMWITFQKTSKKPEKVDNLLFKKNAKKRYIYECAFRHCLNLT